MCRVFEFTCVCFSKHLCGLYFLYSLAKCESIFYCSGPPVVLMQRLFQVGRCRGQREGPDISRDTCNIRGGTISQSASGLRVALHHDLQILSAPA